MTDHTFNSYYWCDRCGRSYQEVKEYGIECRQVAIVDNARAIALRMRELQEEQKAQPVETPLTDKLVDAFMCGWGVTP